MAKVKYILLIPLTYNDGSRVSKSVLRRIRNAILDLAGGYTATGIVEGAYRMKSGERQIDASTQYWVVIEESKEPDFKLLVAGFADLLKQECIYLERVTSTVEFIEPPGARGEQNEDKGTETS